jgi:thioredoxin-like negative regulator of GroEL
LAPVLDELARDYAGRVKFTILNLDQNKVVASHEGVTGTPTLFFYSKGKLTDRLVGVVSQVEIARRLNSLLSIS